MDTLLNLRKRFISMIGSSNPVNVKQPVQNKFIKEVEAIPKLKFSSSEPKRKPFFCMSEL
jgi:hypothetical protein